MQEERELESSKISLILSTRHLAAGWTKGEMTSLGEFKLKSGPDTTAFLLLKNEDDEEYLPGVGLPSSPGEGAPTAKARNFLIENPTRNEKDRDVKKPDFQKKRLLLFGFLVFGIYAFGFLLFFCIGTEIVLK